jgi:hypothetical protein
MSWIGNGDVDKEINNAKSIKDLNNWREKENKLPNERKEICAYLEYSSKEVKEGNDDIIDQGILKEFSIYLIRRCIFFIVLSNIF